MDKKTANPAHSARTGYGWMAEADSVFQALYSFVIGMIINVLRVRGRGPNATFLNVIKAIKECSLGGTVIPA
ncbi:hypothetical protein Vadar_003486 [Vaccinium darrowii]|uniref:Uncharacterized protein n=1 Tax=Vaccinium darrowii TaxID=229202 RepID=A0ACB7XMY2_9ERIC|nr:hypothetical protein Vadar_003486 [Vaccinium darrowii]